MFCNQCGHRNPAGANFCSSCGAALEHLGTTETTITFYPDGAGDASSEVKVPISEHEIGMLIVRRGPNSGATYALERDLTTVGRHPDCDIFLDDVTVSRRHVEIARRPGQAYRLTDIGSLNGTYVNRARVEAVDLHSGDELQIGKFRLVFVSLAHDQAPGSAKADSNG